MPTSFTSIDLAFIMGGISLMVASALGAACVDRICCMIERVHGWKEE